MSQNWRPKQKIPITMHDKNLAVYQIMFELRHNWFETHLLSVTLSATHRHNSFKPITENKNCFKLSNKANLSKNLKKPALRISGRLIHLKCKSLITTNGGGIIGDQIYKLCIQKIISQLLLHGVTTGVVGYISVQNHIYQLVHLWFYWQCPYLQSLYQMPHSSGFCQKSLGNYCLLHW